MQFLPLNIFCQSNQSGASRLSFTLFEKAECG